MEQSEMGFVSPVREKKQKQVWPKRSAIEHDPLNPHEFLIDWDQWYEDMFKVKPMWTRAMWAQYDGQFAKAINLYGNSHVLRMMRRYWDVGERQKFKITVDGFFRCMDSLYQQTKRRA